MSSSMQAQAVSVKNLGKMATHEIAATTPDWKAGVPWLGEWEG